MATVFNPISRIKLVVETFIDCQQLLDRAEIVKKMNDDFNNSVCFLMKSSKKVDEIFIVCETYDTE